MKTIEQQLSEAKARALTARIEIDSTNSLPDGSLTLVTSEQKASETYAVTRDIDGNLACNCPARVVCKHIGLCLLTGNAYHVDPMQQAQAARLAAFCKVDAWLASLPEVQMAAALALVAQQNEQALAEEWASAGVTLAGVTSSEESKLIALARAEVASILSYAIVTTPILARRMQAERAEAWERYQEARQNNFYC